MITVEVHRPPDGVIALGQAADAAKATRLAASCARVADRGAQLTLMATRSPYLLLMWAGEGAGRELQAVAITPCLALEEILWYGEVPA